MALGPISNVPRPIPQVPDRDVSEARRAFFQAALGQAPAVQPPIQAVAPQSAAPQSVAPRIEAPKAAAEPAPSPRYRPGSLIDIKV
jgi:hypothetical protein